MIQVDLTIAPTLNFAMEQSGVPLVSGVRVHNTGADTLEGARLTFTLAPDLGEPTVVPLDPIRPGEERYLPAVDIRLPPGRLRAVVEAERASLTWAVVRGEEWLASGDAEVQVLAFNEWPGLRAPPALLAAFVMPNHPVVGQILKRARDRLRDTTGDAALSGYQTRSPRRVVQMVEALVWALQDLGVTYVGVAASFEAVGQKVRLPDMVLADGMGNCLDVTVLLAACLEQMGLHPLAVIVKGHALPAVWLVDDRFPEGVVYDAARLRTLGKLGQVLVFDSSTCVRSERPPLETAVAAALEHLADDASFVCAVDVAVVRMDRFRPLPLRITTPLESASPAAQAILAEAAREPAPAAEPAAPPPPPEPVVARFRRWRDRLLDLSLNNRLLNYRPGTKASLSLLVPDVARFEDILSSDASFEILPRPDVDPRDERDPDLAKARADEASLDARRRTDLERRILYTDCPREELLARAVELDRAARVDREEGGANTLFAAIGMLRWFESSTSELPRLAPLLLVPVRLEYDRITRRIRLRRVEEDPVGNVTLAEKMRRDFAIDLSAAVTPEADEAGVDVAGLLRRARQAIAQTPRWEVLDQVQLGLFTFTKFLMWKDLDANADVLLQSEVVRHIANSGKTPYVDRVGEPDPRRLDDDVPAAALPAVLDCDSTQLAAVNAALRGRSFVLQGPPGTGKSQTITNLIAGALAEGKTVLFVSEKMAALDVVYRRLRDAGLGDYCLELHSNKANKKEVVTSLGQSLDRATRVSDANWEDRSKDLGDLRDQLNAYTRALHASRPLNRTFYQGSARLLALREAPEVRVPLPEGVGLTEARWRQMSQALDAFAVSAREVEPVPAHPWRESRGVEWSAAGEEDARDAVADALAALDAAENAARALGTQLGSSAPPGDTLVALGRAVGAGPVPELAHASSWPAEASRARAWVTAAREDRAARADLAERWKDRLHTLDVTGLYATFRSWARAFFLFAFFFLFFPRRALAPVAKGRLPDDLRIEADLAVAAALRKSKDERAKEQAWAAAAFAGAWDGSDPDDLARALDRAEQLRAALALWRAEGRDTPAQALSIADPAVPAARREAVAAATREADERLAALRAALDRVRAALAVDLVDRTALLAYAGAFDRFRAWCFYKRAAAGLDAAGLAPLAQAHAAGTLGADAVPTAGERAVLTRWVAAVRDAEPALRGFDGVEHERRVLRFRELDRAHLHLGRQRVLARLDARRPPTRAGAADTSEPGILAREVKKQRAHMPVRKLLQTIPNLLPRLKPCLLMSPLSIAQYLPADGRRFDLVVFDEASQIGTHDAIGAIARGEQVVIVGDSRQLPPTSFFARDTAEETLPDENDVLELESILDEAIAAQLPQQMLGWHYRSRHEALIDFSNRHYYENRLNVFPAARGKVADLGMHWHAVTKGVYDKGRTRQNRVEAEALVRWLVAELRGTQPGARTFGVVTFSLPQQTLIQDLLDRARGQVPEIEGHFSDGILEPVFVKNLENVQGDERDVVLFSVCYGPDEAGRTWMNFGPLNRTGGERRLNVAITRARRALHVFSTLTADMVDLGRTTATGARHLKAFLAYAAERGGAVERRPHAQEFETNFERQVHDALVHLGYQVDTQVGCGGYRIDLAVIHPNHPGEYLLGVECDGATYHSGATARDRDRLRQEVLQGLGWRLHRVWSTDWWFDPAKETAKLESAIRAAREAPLAPRPREEGRGGGPEAPVEEPPAPVEEAPAVQEGPPLAPYRVAALAVVSEDREAMYLTSAVPPIRARIAELVSVEGPIHVDEVCRRVAACWSVAKLTDRVRRRVLEFTNDVVIHGEFVWPKGTDPAKWAVLRGALPDGSTREPELIAPEEVAAGVEWVLSHAMSLEEATLARETARVFGLARLGRKVDERMRAGIEVVIARGKAAREGERVAWRG